MPDIERSSVPTWELRRRRVEETADAILRALEGGGWVLIWPTLCDAQLRAEDGYVDVALVESISALKRRGHKIERRERDWSSSPPPAYRLLNAP